ncbi:uncharacterized protein UMAG_01883 [Mycosarcoma maydis]|uniref:Thioredoxin-like fold domain-containing protein n=1 Tax=Mycosarcoma maydis TaxID=5270 RepID=A0A0D1CWG0_MYCMD|nr:uncharacterized protein UMAG_01883 [Ustilago maydis 521]KIS70728.1 hypothetical protein UMAG_01883 [Ustilago maydis 521]|eukprot:XP_011387818.1 hypothetical protein UMAG_01883 [Ustilago maydis 521]
MALPPSLQALSIGSLTAPNTLELFLDYLCPFSAKQLKGVNEYLLPLVIGDSAQYKDKVRIVIRPYPQPWHSSSTLLHESALAVAKIALTDPAVTAVPERNAFWLYSLELMKEQERFFDGPARGKSPDGIRGELATLAIETVGEAPKKRKQPAIHRDLQNTPLGQSVKNLIRVEKEGNGGSAVVPELKYCVKLGRQNGIHVTPTCLWNGLVEASISSSFDQAAWKEFLEKQLA